MTKGPYQIKREANPHEPGKYDFRLIDVESGRLIFGEYRCKSPVPPNHLRSHQATLNTQALLDDELLGLLRK